MRYFLSALAIVALTSGSAFGIVVDGSIDDWEAAGLVHDSPIATPLGALAITHFGATVVGDMFYAFMQIDQPVSNFDRIYPGAYINADQNLATELGLWDDDLEEYVSLPSAIAGTDIVIEWDYETRYNPPYDEMPYYGLNDDIGQEIGPTGGLRAAANDILEWSAPVQGIWNALASLPDDVSSDFRWNVYIAGEGHLAAGGGWDPDFAGPIDIPEPGSMALLAGAGLTLVLMGLARLRRRCREIR